MFEELVSDILNVYGRNDTTKVIDEAIRRASEMKVGSDTETIRRQGAELLVLAVRASYIRLPNPNFPVGSLVVANISNSLQGCATSSGDLPKKYANFVTELQRARDVSVSNLNEMRFHGSIARALVSAAKIAIEPMKNDLDLKVIQKRLITNVSEILAEASSAITHPANDYEDCEPRRAAVG